MTAHRFRLSCCALLALLAGGSAYAGNTYRWVDEKGQVHYGDYIPSKDAGLGNAELDKQGRVLKENPRTRFSPEERRRLEEARERREAAKREEERQQRRDRALLTTYVSEKEIDLARDRSLDLEVANLRGLKARMNAAAEKLAYANGQIAHYSQVGQAVPSTFSQMREEAQAELARLGQLIQKREQAMEDIKASYEADKLRFRELKGLSPR